MGLCIVCGDVVGIVGNNHWNAQFLGKAHNAGIYICLLAHAVVLHLQEVIAFPKNIKVAQCCSLCTVVVISSKVYSHFAGKTCGKGDNSLVVLLKKFHVHTRLVVKALGVTL